MKGKRKIYFRADASDLIGYGHFIRTLALADMLKNDFDCIFFTSNPNAYQISEMEKVCPYVELQEGSKFDTFLHFLNGEEIVVLDNYFFSTDYQILIKQKGCHLVCVDDMHNKHYVADVVINQSITDQILFDIEPYTKLCLGIDWMLLRAPFLNCNSTRSNINEGITKVAVSFGGTDPLNLTHDALLQLNKCIQLESIDVIGGNLTESVEDTRIKYHNNISAQDVCAIFSNCDIAIVSLSTVCLEALMCGAYVVSGWYADNQKEGYYSLLKQGVIHGLGNIEKGLPDLSPYILKKNVLPKLYIPQNIPHRYINLFNTL